MKFSTTKIALSLSKKINAEGHSEILLKAVRKINGKAITMRTDSGVFIDAAFFDEVKGVDLNKKRVIPPDVRKWHNDAKEKLNGILSAVAKQEELSNDNMTGDWLRNIVEAHLHPKEAERKKSFFEFADEYLKQSTFSEGYRKQVFVTLRTVARYIGFVRATDKKQRNFSFDPETIDRDIIEDFQSYVRNEYALSQEYPDVFKVLVKNYPPCINDGLHIPISNHGENCVHSRLKQLKVMWNWLIGTRRVANNPFEGFKNVGENYGVPNYLTLSERDKIASTPMPTEALSRQRDIFIFQCYVGCRVSDLMTFTEKNIINGVLEYVPIKTHKEKEARAARVPLHPMAKILIDKYRGVDTKGRLFPFIAPQNYNDTLKRIFEIANITRNVPIRNPLTGKDEMKSLSEIASSHLARRTFIANLYLKVQDPSIIGKMSGHSENSTSFGRYRKIEDEILNDAVTRFL